jgi:hypothetical protein
LSRGPKDLERRIRGLGYRFGRIVAKGELVTWPSLGGMKSFVVLIRFS